MSDQWYDLVDPSIPITQGDVIQSCLISSWISGEIDWSGVELSTSQTILKADVIVMTQACDLENDKVKNVILCPADPVSKVRESVSSDAKWKSFWQSVLKGHQWNFAVLDSYVDDSSTLEHRIVNFHEVYTLPKTFLESFVRGQKEKRLRLLSPYREHLSQSFARYFMRVGLPASVKPLK